MDIRERRLWQRRGRMHSKLEIWGVYIGRKGVEKIKLTRQGNSKWTRDRHRDLETHRVLESHRALTLPRGNNNKNREKNAKIN